MRRKEINFDYDPLNRLTKITNALAGKIKGERIVLGPR